MIWVSPVQWPYFFRIHIVTRYYHSIYLSVTMEMIWFWPLTWLYFYFQDTHSYQMASLYRSVGYHGNDLHLSPSLPNISLGRPPSSSVSSHGNVAYIICSVIKTSVVKNNSSFLYSSKLQWQLRKDWKYVGRSCSENKNSLNKFKCVFYPM